MVLSSLCLYLFFLQIVVINKVGQSHILKMSNCSFFCANKVPFGNSHIFRTFSHIRSFRKSECAIIHFQRAKKCAIAHLHIKERQNVRLHIRTFSKSDKKHNRSFEMSKCANMCEKSANFEITLFCTLKRLHNCSFEKSECAKMCKKRAISESNFFRS